MQHGTRVAAVQLPWGPHWTVRLQDIEGSLSNAKVSSGMFLLQQVHIPPGIAQSLTVSRQTRDMYLLQQFSRPGVRPQEVEGPLTGIPPRYEGGMHLLQQVHTQSGIT